MGGGSSAPTAPTVTQVAAPVDVPLQAPLEGASTREINQAGAFAPYGSGGELLPQAQLGQVYLGGPNPTEIGQPTNPSQYTANFGQVGSYNEPGANQQNTGASAYGSGGGASNTSYGSIMSSLSGLFGGLPGNTQSQLGAAANQYLGGGAPSVQSPAGTSQPVTTQQQPAQTGNGSIATQSPVTSSLTGTSSQPISSAAGPEVAGAAPQGAPYPGLTTAQGIYNQVNANPGAGTSLIGRQSLAATPQTSTSAPNPLGGPQNAAQYAAAQGTGGTASQPTQTGTSSNGQFSTTGSPLTQAPTLQPGSVIPGSGAGDLPTPNIQPGAPPSVQNAFLSTAETSPYYNQAEVAGNLGTASGQAVQPAANFMQQLFSPNLSSMSQAYLQAGAANAGINMQQGIGQLQSQYENDPFNTALGRSEANLISQTANNTLQTAAGMGVQQQQIAANQIATPFNLTAQNAATGVTDAQGLYNTANAQFNAPYQEANTVYSQIPISSPVVTPGTQAAPKAL